MLNEKKRKKSFHTISTEINMKDFPEKPMISRTKELFNKLTASTTITIIIYIIIISIKRKGRIK